MSAPVSQQYSNHARVHPPFHYVLVPLLFIHFIHVVVQLVRYPSLDRLDAVLLATALIIMALLTRVNALKAQDRVIRLEEQLRYQAVLPPDVARKASALPVGQIIALRFASDAELPGLVEQALAGQFAKTSDLKKAIRNWRPDYFRV